MSTKTKDDEAFDTLVGNASTITKVNNLRAVKNFVDYHKDMIESDNTVTETAKDNAIRLLYDSWYAYMEQSLGLNRV